ncbi:MAG: AMP-binding protein, partial [Burkholderiaceae bacterium]
MTLDDWAERRPDDTALVFTGSGRRFSFAELAAQGAASAHWLIELGLAPGEGVAALLENRGELITLALGARRAGLYFSPLSVHLQQREIAFMLRDCGARILIVSSATAELAQRALSGDWQGAVAPAVWCVDESADAPSLSEALRGRPADAARLPPRPVGRDLLYSSGTTGMPRAIRKPLRDWAERHVEDREVATWRRVFGFDPHSVYYSAAPLYHAAPLRYALRTVDVGARCVMSEKFDAESALRALGEWQVTHSQWVPTMFVRMLALPQPLREPLRPASMKVAIHAAAPCPVPVKQAMIDWWGPVLYEYYAGSEAVGMTAIDSTDWLAHRGSVGKAVLGRLRIVDEHGAELPAGEIGQVYFEGGPRFEYLNDPVKTASAYNAAGWATYGDIGHMDADGYLYLSDRRADLIL